MKPLTDRFRNRLNTMARETKNATKKTKNEGCSQVVGCKRRNDNECH